MLTSHKIDDHVKMLAGVLENLRNVLIFVVDRLKDSQALHVQAV